MTFPLIYTRGKINPKYTSEIRHVYFSFKVPCPISSFSHVTVLKNSLFWIFIDLTMVFYAAILMSSDLWQ